MRILLVGPGSNYKYGAGFFYNYVRRLANGFIRSGHCVVHFSDRDCADYALGIRQIGRFLAARRFREIAAALQPDLICIVHVDLIAPSVVAEAASSIPDCRVAVVEFDPQFDVRPSARMRRWLAVADAGFATTGGSPLREQAAGGKPVYFIPNPLDPAIDDRLAYRTADPAIDVLFCSWSGEFGVQWQKALAVQRHAPMLIYGYYGMNRARGLEGNDYLTTLARARIGLSLNQREGGLYASDRLAQYLGNGLLVACDRASGYDQVFTDDEMMFFDGAEDLADKCRSALQDDFTWRRRACDGRQKALSLMNCELVTDFILRMSRQEPAPKAWRFSQFGWNADDPLPPVRQTNAPLATA